MIDFDCVQHPIRNQNRLNFLDILKQIKSTIMEFDYVIDVRYEKKNLYKDRVRSLTCKRSFKNRYIFEIDLEGERKKTVTKTFVIDFPEVFNGMIMLNDCIRIPIMQYVDKSVELLTARTVRIFNNVHEITINYNEKKNKFSCQLMDNKVFPLLPVLVTACGGFKNMLKMHFSHLNIELKKDTLEREENVSENLIIDTSNLTEKDEYKLQIFNFVIPTDIHRLKHIDLNNIKSWKAMNSIAGKSVVDMFMLSNKLDIFTDITSNVFSSAFECLCNPEIRKDADNFNEELKRDRNDITGKRIRIFEILVGVFLEHLFNLFVIRKRMKADSETKLDLCKKIYKNKDVTTLYQMYDEYFSIISIMYELNKLSFLGYQNIDKKRISIHRRIIHDTYKRTVCPIATPDGDNCGVINQLCAGVKRSQLEPRINTTGGLDEFNTNG